MNFTDNKLYIDISKGFVAALSVFIGIFIILNKGIEQGYELLYLLPLVFGLCFVVFLCKPFIKSNSIFLWTFMIFAALRYLALPYFMVSEGFYRGYAVIPPDPWSIKTGIFLMLYEIVLASMVIKLVYEKHSHILTMAIKEPKIKCENLIKNKMVYYLFLAFALLIILIHPKSIQGISFFSIINSTEIGQQSTLTILFRQIVMVAKLILYFILVDHLRFKYNTTSKPIYLWISYLLSILNIGIYIGINRKNIIMNAIASIFTLNFFFPKQKKKTWVILGLLAVVLFMQLTMFRFYSGSDKGPFDRVAGKLQVYLSGPYNMALATETLDEFGDEITAFNVLYDVARPFYGVGEFFKRFDTQLSTDYFNKRLTLGSPYVRTDQIMPITGQGLLHFGYILSPVYLIISILMGFYVEIKLKSTEDFQIRYKLIIMCVVIGQSMGINLTIITNVITFNFIPFFIVYWMNSKISRNTIMHCLKKD